jgi:hypothetical protein
MELTQTLDVPKMTSEYYLVAFDSIENHNTSSKVNVRSKNDIKDIKSFKQLDKVELDLESPRFL